MSAADKTRSRGSGGSVQNPAKSAVRTAANAGQRSRERGCSLCSLNKTNNYPSKKPAAPSPSAPPTAQENPKTKMAAIKEPGQLDDDGKVDGYPVEGLCLAVLGGRGAVALCRKEDNRQSSRLRVLIYGDPAGKARLLTSSERVDALPSTDEALAARLQGDWKNATATERDELLRGCDEMEARRAAPPQFLDMVTRLRAGAKGDAKSLAPSSSAGRDPNPAPPRGDAVRVLWDQSQWYEAAAVEARSPRCPAGLGLLITTGFGVLGGPGRRPEARRRPDYRALRRRWHQNALVWPDPGPRAFY